MKKNGFLTFCFSFIPGAGQMYQTYMKRGLSIMILFALSIAVSAILNASIFIIPALIIWAYSFFDTFHIRNSIETENKYVDNYILSDNNSNILNNFMSKKSYLIGIGLILIGIYLLFNNILGSIANNLDLYWIKELLHYIRQYLPSVIIAALSIGIGIKLMFNKKD